MDPQQQPPQNNNQGQPPTVYSPSQPQGGMPQSPPNPTQFAAFPTGPQKSKRPLLIGLIAGSILLLLIITAVVLLSSGGTESPQPQEGPQQSSTPASPQPAQAIDVEQANNAINQDLSGVDTDKDFPSDTLSDEKLAL